jgi:signal transduction histidine kinase
MKLLFLLLFITNIGLATDNSDSLLKVTSVMKPDSNKVMNLISISTIKQNSPVEAINYVLEALKISRDLENIYCIASSLHSLGNFSVVLGDYPKSLEYLFEEAKIRESIPNDENLGYTYAALGETFRANSDYKSSLVYLQKGMEIFDKLNHQTGRCKILNRESAVYFEIATQNKDMNALNKSETLANMSLELSKRINDEDIYQNNLVILGAIYNYIHNFEKARECLFEALSSMRKDTSDFEISNVLFNISNSYSYEKKFSTALPYALEGYEIAVRKAVKVHIFIGALTLKEIYLGLGNYPLAYHYLELQNNTQFEIYNIDNSKRIAYLQNKFESEKNELNIAKDRKEMIFMIIILSLALILIATVAFTLYYRIRSHKKRNILLEEYNKLISEQKEKLTELNSSKDKFFSIVAHDLRNPFNGLYGFSKLLLDDYHNLSEAERLEYLGYIQKSSEDILKLVEDLLNWSRLQTGKIEFIPEKFDFYDEVNAVCKLLKVNAIKKNITINNAVKPNNFVVADRNMVNTILRNLVSNAIKFSYKGRTITIKSTQDNEFTRATIEDTGAGIEESGIDCLFKIDKQYIRKGTENEDGTGLGLIICKEMVDLHKGKIWVESVKDKGSLFHFSIPSAH